MIPQVASRYTVLCITIEVNIDIYTYFENCQNKIFMKMYITKLGDMNFVLHSPWQ